MNIPQQSKPVERNLSTTSQNSEQQGVEASFIGTILPIAAKLLGSL